MSLQSTPKNSRFPSLIYFLWRPLIDLLKPSSLDKYFIPCSRVPPDSSFPPVLSTSPLSSLVMPSTTQDHDRTGGGAGSVTAAPACVCAGLSRWRLFTMQMEAGRIAYIVFYIGGDVTAATGGNVQVGVKEMEENLPHTPGSMTEAAFLYFNQDLIRRLQLRRRFWTEDYFSFPPEATMPGHRC